ncbi:MAG: hypothetical protein SGJ27_26370 [Candidatus Melainabacteria bacterium]|nr:hypothetical protein [Candidatus Melainabacteria bacterium]
MQSWIFSGLAAIFLINAICLIFMGNYTERGSSRNTYKSHEFEKNPIGFSLCIGLLFVLGLTCLHFGQPHWFPVAVKKVPQLAYIYTVLKMKNGLYYLIGGGFLAASILAFIFRKTITSVSTFSQGSEDIHPDLIKRHEAQMRAETPDWKRDGDSRAAGSQFDDGTPL